MKYLTICCLISLLSTSIVFSQTENEGLGAELQQLQVQVDRLDSANDSLKTVLYEVKKDKRYLSYLVRKLLDSLQVAEARIVTVNNKNAALTDSIASLEKTIDKNYTALNEAIENTTNTRQNQVKSLRESLSSNILYGASAGGFLIVLLGGVFFLSRRMLGTQKQALETKIDRTRYELEEEAVQMDQKLVQLLESQQQIAHQYNSQNTVDEEPDHSLALKVADQIVRIEKNLSKMDPNINGLKQLQTSVKRIKDNFEASGYEMVDLLNKPFDDRMKATIVNTIPDENLKDGERIVTRIIKPQVNYNGEMIQPAQVEVSEG